jgi:N-acetylneuraminate synthase
MDDFLIGKRLIGKDHKPFIIAELSGNHGGSLDRALDLVKSAAATGADAVKFQTYTPDTITIKSDREEFLINDPSSLWHGRTLYDLYEEAHTPWEWHAPMFELARNLGIEVFSSPFDLSSVDFLEDLDVSAYKIASLEISDVQLIKKVAQTKKPLIMSTGAAKLEDIENAIKIARENGAAKIILLKCTSAYPALPEDANLRSMATLSRLFNCHVGLSDHTLGTAVSIASIALGASVIEKHFIDDKSFKTVDSSFSLDHDEFKFLVDQANIAWESLGNESIMSSTSESTSISHKRSIYVVEDIKKGDIFSYKNLKSIRPGNGLAVKHLEDFIGKKSRTSIRKGTPLKWTNLADEN